MEEKEPQQEQNSQQMPQSTPPEVAQLEELSKKISATEKQVEYYKDLLLRKAAEFDNYKKRVDSEAASVLKFAKIDLITELLPVVDDFERSLKQSKNHKDSEAFAKGAELIYQKFMKFLESQGLKAMETEGKAFDVHYHDALLQIQRDDMPHHTIIEEVEKGYLLEDKVIRHAKVVVSSSSAEHPAPETENAKKGSNGGAPRTSSEQSSDTSSTNDQAQKG
jgi:molecular chaperone GrpE